MILQGINQIRPIQFGIARQSFRFRERLELGNSQSEAIYDHHAFSFWAPLDLLMIPLESKEEEANRIGLELYGVSAEDGFTVTGFVDHQSLVDEDFTHARIRRSIVMGDNLVTVSTYGLMSHDLESLESSASVAFPDPNHHGGGRGIGGGGGPEPAPVPQPEEADGEAEEGEEDGESEDAPTPVPG